MHNKIIRFRRIGRKYYTVFEIVLIKKTKANRGNFITKLGFFNPNIKERFLFLNLELLAFYLNRGAHLHKTIKKYLVKFIIK